MLSLTHTLSLTQGHHQVDSKTRHLSWKTKFPVGKVVVVLACDYRPLARVVVRPSRPKMDKKKFVRLAQRNGQQLCMATVRVAKKKRKTHTRKVAKKPGSHHKRGREKGQILFDEVFSYNCTHIIEFVRCFLLCYL